MLIKKFGRGLPLACKIIVCILFFFTIKARSQIITSKISCDNDIFINGEVHLDNMYVFYQRQSLDTIIYKTLEVFDSTINYFITECNVKEFILEEPISKQIFYQTYLSGLDTSIQVIYNNNKYLLGKLSILKQKIKIYNLNYQKVNCIDLEYREDPSDALKSFIAIALVLPFNENKLTNLFANIGNDSLLGSNLKKIYSSYPESKAFYFLQYLLNLKKNKYECKIKDFIKSLQFFSDSAFYNDFKKIIHDENNFEIFKKIIANCITSYEKKQNKNQINKFRESMLNQRVLDIINKSNFKVYLNTGNSHIDNPHVEYILYNQLKKNYKTQAYISTYEFMYKKRKSENKSTLIQLNAKSFGFEIFYSNQ